MVKHWVFNFEKLPVENHWITFASFGKMITVDGEFFESAASSSIKVDNESVWQIGIDQSTSNTGIFMKNYDNTEAHMIEVSREDGQDAGQFIFELELFLHNLLKDTTISHMIYETPILTKVYRSSRTAFQLEGMLCAMPKRYAEYKTTTLDDIENQAWRSAVVDKELDRVYERKVASKMAVERIYPWCSHYGFSLGKDNDVFEALGILMGWFLKSFDQFGRPYVRGAVSTREVGGFIFPDMPVSEMSKALEEAGVEHKVLIENPSYSIYKNIAASVKPYEVKCLEMTNPYAMLCLCLECNVKWEDPECMSVVITDAATCHPVLREFSGGSFHFVL